MRYHLEQAAKFSKSRESTLNVSESVSFMFIYVYNKLIVIIFRLTQYTDHHSSIS